MKMTTETNASGEGNNEGAGGANKNDSVSYETYLRTLNQHKQSQQKLQDVERELEAFREEKRKQEEQKQIKNGETMALVTARDEKIKELESKLSEATKEVDNSRKILTESKKLDAFTRALPAPISNPKYLAFVNTENIVINDSGAIDQTTLKKEVEDFVKEHSALLLKNSSKMPADAASGNATLSYEDWKKLPLADQKKRIREVKI